MSFRKQFFLFVVLVAVAAILRFHCLGAWSFGFDELFTTMETKILVGEKTVSEDSQYYRLPHLLCAAYYVHWFDYKLFGEDEFGSRVLMAAMGSLCIGVVFLLARPLFGTSGASILALLLMLLPEHIMQSQCNRFYSQSVFFIAIVLLLGGHLAANRSVAAALWLGPAAVIMVLSHALGGVIWSILLGGCLVDLLCSMKYSHSSKIEIPWKIIVIVTIWSVLLLGIAVFHILPLAASWNQSSSWGYSPLHAMMSFINILSWPFFLLGGLGILFVLTKFRKPGNGYWAFCAILSGLAIGLLPLKITYNPLYGILFVFPFLAVAAMFIDHVYQLLSKSNIPFAQFVAVCWIVLCVLLNFPAIISYYKDGCRPDNRSAFHYVAEHWQNGDRLTGFLMGAGDYYIPDCQPKIPLSPYNTATKLQKILDTGEGGTGRLWIVVPSTRGGLDNDLRRWLGSHALYETRFGNKRFDYIENNVEIFYVPPKHSEP